MTVLGTPFAEVKLFGSWLSCVPRHDNVAAFKSRIRSVRVFGSIPHTVFGIRLPAEIPRGETRQESTPLGREIFREPKSKFAQRLCKSLLKVRISGRRTVLFSRFSVNFVDRYVSWRPKVSLFGKVF
jgi:hypothetical protein